MNRIFKLEIKRAFRNRLFAATLCVAFAICVWHFMENVWIWRMYVYYDTYPLSAYEKWIGADNASVQPLLLYLIMPALCAIPYGRSFYFDVKSGYAAQIISRGKKSDYIRAKYGAAFVSGALIGICKKPVLDPADTVYHIHICVLHGSFCKQGEFITGNVS